MREQRVVLEDGVHAPLERRQVGDLGLADVDRAGGDLLEAADHPQRRGLAAARRAEQGEELAVLDGKRQIVDRGEFPEPFRDPIEPDVSVGHQRLANLVALL
jgi:hypothetical protein